MPDLLPLDPEALLRGPVHDERQSGGLALGDHAQRRAATSGNGLLRVEVVWPAGGRGLELRWTRGHTAFEEHKAMTAQPHQPFVVTVPVDLDAIATAGPDVVATAARVGSEIVQAFGLAEMPQFAPQGQIPMSYWASNGGFRPGLTAWATEHGVTLS